MELSWLLGLIHEKHRNSELGEALGDFYEKLSTEHKKAFLKALKTVALRIDHDEAHEIVKRMMPYGENWAIDQIRKVIAGKGVSPEKEIHYYLVMNMAYNDYRKTAEKFSLEDNVDFYFCIAHDFIEDPDAKEFKVELYFM